MPRRNHPLNEMNDGIETCTGAHEIGKGTVITGVAMEYKLSIEYLPGNTDTACMGAYSLIMMYAMTPAKKTPPTQANNAKPYG
jgi:hypothetical protein